MPECLFDLTDLIEFFGVEPVSEEYGTCHTFTVERDGLVLDFSIFPYDADVYITLSRIGFQNTLFHLKVIRTPMVKFRKEKRSCLEIAPGRILEPQFQPVSHPDSLIEMGFMLSIDPDFYIAPFYK